MSELPKIIIPSRIIRQQAEEAVRRKLEEKGMTAEEIERAIKAGRKAIIVGPAIRVGEYRKEIKE